MEHYLHISSADCLSIYPYNKPTCFTVKCNLDLNCDKWKVALTEVSFNPQFKEEESVPAALCFFLDCCESNYIYGQYRQIIRKVPVLKTYVHKVFEKPYYVKVSKTVITHITVSLTTENLSFTDLTSLVSLTLHFKRK